MTCNIIITHRGNPPHLKYVLAQLKESNPNANIILMGDESNNKYKFIKHVYLADYFDGANKFANDYIHMNGTSIDYELFCYQRWFAVYEYMQKHNLEDVFSLDSDVLVYDDLETLHSLVSKYSFAVSAKDLTESNPGWWIAGPPIGYFHRDALRELLNFFINSYHDKKYLDMFDIKMAHHKSRGEPYGVCDMTQIFLFTRENADKFFNLSIPFKLNGEYTYIDETILDTANCVAENGHKKIQFINGTAYGFDANDGKKLRFPLIHFQGYNPVNAKEWIPDYYRGKRYRFVLWIREFTRRMRYKKICYKLGKRCKIATGNIVYFPKNKKCLEKLTIRISGHGNILDLSQVRKNKGRAKIVITGDNNKIMLSNMHIRGLFELNCNGNDSNFISQSDVLVDNMLSCLMSSKCGISIGQGTTFFNTSIQSIHANTSVIIGRDCMFSYNTYLYNSDGHPIVNENDEIVNKPHDLVIGNHVWISWNACVLKGVSIKDNCIIGRSAVVTKSVSDSDCVIAGNPAMVCKKLKGTWKREHPDFLN